MFNKEDEVISLHEDPLVVTLRFGSSDVCHKLVDTRSSVDLLFLSTLHALEVNEEDVVKKEMPLIGFNSSTMYALGTFKFPIRLKELL